MPLFDGAAAATGLSEQPEVSGFLSKAPAPYGGAYFVYDPRGKDQAEFSPPWSVSRPLLLEPRSPAAHLPGTPQQTHRIYRRGGGSSDDGRSHAASLGDAPLGRGFTLYGNPPGTIGAASAAFCRQKSGGDLSAAAETSAYLAVPKLVFGPNPCCHEPGCAMGPAYGTEHGVHRAPAAGYEYDWTKGASCKGERAALQRTAPDGPQQRRRQQNGFSGAEQMQRLAGIYSPGRTRAFPAVLEPSYSGYACAASHAIFGSLGEPSQHLQASSRGYLGPHPSYEHAASEVYQERSHMSKYGQLAQHPMFYFPQAGSDQERTHCKDVGGKQREDAPLMVTHALPGHFQPPPRFQSEIAPRRPGAETQPAQSFVHGLDYPCYAAPGIHLSANQMGAPATRRPAAPEWPAGRLEISPGGDWAELPAVCEAQRHRSRPAAGLRLQQLHALLRPRRRSPTRGAPMCTSRPEAENGSVPGVNADQRAPPSGGGIQDSPCLEAREPDEKRQKEALASLATWLPQTDYYLKYRKVIYSPLAVSGGTTAASWGNRKRKLSPPPSPPNVKEEEKELCIVEFDKKRRKPEEEPSPSGRASSPPMPIIDNVFSLAPCQVYLRDPRAGAQPQRSVLRPESRELKPGSPVAWSGTDAEELPPAVCAPQTPEFKIIKVEEIHPADVDVPAGCDRAAVKTEPAEVRAVSMMPAESKREPDDPRPPPADETEPPGEPGSIGKISSSPEEADHVTPPHPPETRPTSEPNRQLCIYKVLLSDTHLSEPPPPPPPPPLPPPRKHFIEMHSRLRKLVSKSVSASPLPHLRAWLSRAAAAEAAGPASPSAKARGVSHLLGEKAREEWLDEEVGSALREVLERLREYTAQGRCPFPHVMRTGAVFLPMLVVKEQLFPGVQGHLIDRVLQEHRVQLRPTTLSEEKILIQLHKRACSSRLRRLMSLKHLPDVYADAVNLLHHSLVCKHLGLADSASQEAAEVQVELRGADLNLSGKTTKSRIKSSSRKMFLDSSWSDGEEEEEQRGGWRAGKGSTASKLSKTGEDEGRGSDSVGAGREASTARWRSTSPEDSWTRPLTADDLSPPPSDTEVKSPRASKSVIGKLKRMFAKELKRKKRRREEASRAARAGRSSGVTAKAAPGRTAGFRRRRSSAAKQRPLLKIKYCPYLSACHSAQHRRRWVLRSAVQTARRAMRFYYPDLVGKRIRHLYEEDDKSEVWYRGEVLSIHEAHRNPLKTIFEVRYDSEPEWRYFLELLMDYQKGWLKIEDSVPVAATNVSEPKNSKRSEGKRAGSPRP